MVLGIRYSDLNIANPSVQIYQVENEGGWHEVSIREGERRTAEEVEVQHSLHWAGLPIVEYCLCILAEDLTEGRHG